MKHLFNGIVAAVLGTLLLTTALLAAPPIAPKNVKATVTTEAANGVNQKVVLITWTPGSGENAPKDFLGFKIYGAKLEANSIPSFSLLGTTDANTFRYTVRNLTAGSYKFYVTAFNNDGETNSEYVAVTFNPADTGNAGGGGDVVKFTSELIKTGYVNESYTYDANATATNGGDVLFSLMIAPQGMTINATTGVISWTPGTTGSFQVKIKAYLASDSTKYALQGGTIVISSRQNGGGNDGQIHFTTEPVKTGSVGKPYSYDAGAEDKNGGTVRYALVSNSSMGIPSGMTIDSLSGLVTWTPSASGTYTYIIRAYLASNPAVYTQQVVVVTVGKCDRRAIVTGKITDQNGSPIGGDRYLIYASVMGGGANTVVAKASISQDGIYRIELDEGTYTLTVIGDNAIISSGNVTVSVKCGDTATANITIERQTITVSGKVTRASDGSPIKGAAVVFVGYDPNDNTFSRPLISQTARTLENGTYEIALPGGNRYVYIAHASGATDEYETQYYDHTASAANATPITGAKTGVDFSLNARQAYQNSISGTVVDSAGNPVKAIVVAYRLSSANGAIGNGEGTAVAKAETDAQGNFIFTNLSPGVYILQVRPVSNDLAGGYYKQNAPVVREWKNATMIQVGSTSTISGITILVPKNYRKGGINKINGSIGKGGITAKGGSQIQSASLPIVDAFVTIIDANGYICGYTNTDDNGNYVLGELTAGIYTVTGDMVGYAATNTPVTVADNPLNLTVVDLSLNSGTSGVRNTVTENTLQLTSVPNPVSNSATLRFTGNGGTAYISITDATGANAISTSISTVNGANQWTLNTNGLADGMYFVRVQNGSATSIVPIVVAK